MVTAGMGPEYYFVCVVVGGGVLYEVWGSMHSLLHLPEEKISGVLKAQPPPPKRDWLTDSME